jgi:hypothetical protein
MTIRKNQLTAGLLVGLVIAGFAAFVAGRIVLGQGYADEPRAMSASAPTASPAKLPLPGPLIGDTRAKQVAADRVAGGVGRQEALLMPYKAIAAFSGSTMHTVHPDRLFYYVVSSGGAYRTRGGPAAGPMVCGSFIVLVDAIDASVLGTGCGGSGSWPERLPPGLPR